MSQIFSSKYTCPICSTEFEAAVIGSTNNFGGGDTEGRTYPCGFDYIAYELGVCPHCGFSSYSFEEPVTATQRKRIVEYLDNICWDTPEKKAYSDQRFEVAAGIMKIRGSGHLPVGRTYLTAAWLMDGDHPDATKRQSFAIYSAKPTPYKYRYKAIQEYEKELASLKPAEIPLEFLFHLAEVCRRGGMFDKALRYFDLLKENSEHFPEKEFDISVFSVEEVLAALRPLAEGEDSSNRYFRSFDNESRPIISRIHPSGRSPASEVRVQLLMNYTFRAIYRVRRGKRIPINRETIKNPFFSQRAFRKEVISLLVNSFSDIEIKAFIHILADIRQELIKDPLDMLGGRWEDEISFGLARQRLVEILPKFMAMLEYELKESEEYLAKRENDVSDRFFAQYIKSEKTECVRKRNLYAKMFPILQSVME